MANILATLFVSLELFAVGFAFVALFTNGGVWILVLMAYGIWLIYLGSLFKAALNLGTGIGLAIAYLLGGIFASFFLYVALLLFGELFMKQAEVNEDAE